MFSVRKQDKPAYFWPGFLSGFCICLFMAATLIYYFANVVGITIKIDNQAITGKMKKQILEAAEQNLPRILAAIREEIPAKIEQKMAQMKDGKILFADMEIKFSPEMMTQIQKSFCEKTVGYLDDSIFHPSNYDALLQELVQNIYSILDRTLQTEVYERKIIWQPMRWWKIPVKVLAEH